MRLAALSDIHGNLPALEAVLDDIASRGAPDAYWVLGDLSLYFPWPAEVLARLRALPGVAFLRGNIDRYVVTGERPAVPVRSARVWAQMPDLLALREARFRWVLERLSYSDYQFLRDLPAQLMMDVPGYGKVAGVHAAPGDDEATIPSDLPDEATRAYFADLDARLILCGHTHIPADHELGAMRVVNCGSIGLPKDGDARAAYALLDFARDSCAITICRVPYDTRAMLAEMERLRFPAWERLAQLPIFTHPPEGS